MKNAAIYTSLGLDSFSLRRLRAKRMVILHCTVEFPIHSLYYQSANGT